MVFDVAIIGAGFSGICLGIKLMQAGIDNFVILEKGDGIGGCWRDNTYPGAACDVPSLLYSYSFEQKPDWSRAFSPQEEIRQYLNRCAEKHDVSKRVRCSVEVGSARFDKGRAVWVIRSGQTTIEAKALVSAVGQLSLPSMPAIPGLSDFRGAAFHSSRFRHDAPIDDARVALVGSGASAIQIAPAIASRVKHLTVFQRSPTWIVPKADRAFLPWEHRLFARLGIVRRFLRYRIYWTFERTYFRIQIGTKAAAQFREACNAYLDQSVPDERLRERLRPDHAPACKRVLKSNDWYPTLQRPNVSLENGSISRVTQTAIVTDDGTAHPVDTIIFATGFQATRFLTPMKVIGLGGRALHDYWKDGAQAYWGITVSGFPNFFMMYGPNTNAHNSIIFLIECQARYITDMVRKLRASRYDYADLKPEVMDGFAGEIGRRTKRFVWADNCQSWYKTSSGRITNNLPYSTLTYFRRTRKADLQNYTLVSTGRPPAARSGGARQAAKPREKTLGHAS